MKKDDIPSKPRMAKLLEEGDLPIFDVKKIEEMRIKRALERYDVQELIKSGFPVAGAGKPEKK